MINSELYLRLQFFPEDLPALYSGFENESKWWDDDNYLFGKERKKETGKETELWKKKNIGSTR